MVSVVLLALMGCEPEPPPAGCEPDQKFEVWLDADGDGFGDPATREVVCTLEEGYVENARDCDDQRSAVNPDAYEICDGIDNDCDEVADEGQRELPYYEDLDGDGYGNFDETVEACSPPPGYVENRGDCNDLDPAINPGAREVCNGGTDDDCNLRADDDDPTLDRTTATTWYYDRDEDGYGGLLDLPFPQEAIDLSGMSNPFNSCVRPEKPEALAQFPGRFTSNVDDCDDTNPDVNPDGVEVCNRIDDDCDQLIDDTDPDLDPAELQTFYADTDADGAGDAANPVEACFQPWFTAANDVDCDDEEPLLQDATGWLLDDDGDGFGAGAPSKPSCTAPSADHVLPALGVDCRDDDDEVYPGAPEVCDTLDNDCDGDIDLLDDDLDIYSATAVWRDVDGDGYGDIAIEAVQCGDPLDGFVADNTDCNDQVFEINPGATEICNEGVDGDCDELGDEDDPDVDLATITTWYFDDDGDGFGNPYVFADACSQPPYYVDNNIDCDDGDEYSGALVAWWQDVDGDGVGAGTPTAPQCGAPDVDYVPAIGDPDCADNNPYRYPGAADVCGDGNDFDCNGLDAGVDSCTPDTCADALAEVPYTAGTYTDIPVELQAHATDLPVIACVGGGLGADAIVPVSVGAGEVVRATASDDDDLYVALLSNCGDGQSCVLGNDGITADAESLAWLNSTGATFQGFVVVGCVSGTCASSSLDLFIGADPLFVADTCADVSGLTPFGTGSYALGGTHLALAADVQMAGGNACTGTPTGGTDALLPVQLAAGEELVVAYDAPAGDAQVYLVADCDNPEATCAASADALAGPGEEVLTYTNASGGQQTLSLVFDCRQATCDDFTANVVIR